MKNGRGINLLDESSDEEMIGERNIEVGIDNHLNNTKNISKQIIDNENQIISQPSAGPSNVNTSGQHETHEQECFSSIILPEINASKFVHNLPLDRFNYTYLIFYLLGITTMCPWNFFVTAEDYWMYKFRNVTDNFPMTNLTPMQKSFTSDLTVTASISGTLFLILNAIYGYLVTLKIKMLGSMFIILALFIVTTAFVEVDTDSWQAGFFLLTLAIVVVINSLSAIMCGGLFGIAGLFPSEYMTAVVSGQALGGIFTALAFIMALTFGASPNTTAFVYFSIGNAILVISIITYVIMSKTTYFQYYVIDKNEQLITEIDNEFVENLDSSLPIDNISEPNFQIIFTKIYLYIVIECLAMATTLSVYPGVTVLVESENHGNGHKWNDVYFLPVANYLAFNSGDYLGRILAGLWEAPQNNPQLLLLFTIVRIGFVPCFMLSNQSHTFLPAYITSDITFIILIVIFAISNGYLANIALIMVPKNVLQHEKEMASSIMAAALSLGLAIGACCSMFFVQIL